MPTLVIYYLRDLLLVNLLWAWIYNAYDLLRWLDVKQKFKIKDQNTYAWIVLGRDHVICTVVEVFFMMKNLTVNVGPKTFPKYTPDCYLDI